jgi:hypothetical protein
MTDAIVSIVYSNDSIIIEIMDCLAETLTFDNPTQNSISNFSLRFIRQQLITRIVG